MTYWYAFQNVDYETGANEGTLWTSPRPPGRETEDARTNIFQLVPGDIVFHHSKSYIRAVSVVTDGWVDAPRGPAHPRPEGEGDDGWLVRVRYIETDVDLHYKDVAQLVEHGSPGPLTIVGAPQRGKFLCPLADEDGNRLLQRLRLEYLYEELHDRPSAEWTSGDVMATSAGAITREAMRSALAEAVSLGREGLRQKYGFGPSQSYVAIHEGHHFDSKALVAAAAAHADAPGALTPENSWGGKSTTDVLTLCGVEWINVGELGKELGPLIPADYSMDESGGRSYWWANQSNNFEEAFEQGSLWASDFRRDGLPGHEDWTALQRMGTDDLVFHYGGQMLRGISRVVTTATPAPRPEGSGESKGYDQGHLVLVEPVVSDIEIRLASLQEILTPGVGPMNRSGTLGGTYVSPLPQGLGGKLVSFLSGEAAAEHVVSAELASEYMPIGPLGQIATDARAIVKRRVEQNYLRTLLLATGTSRCALCGRNLPRELLVAAHIKPRSECSDEERLDFKAAAMLACTLGCDALFELGYIAVDSTGRIRAAELRDYELEDRLQVLDGTLCAAYNPATAPRFQTHWKSKFRGAK